MFYDKNFTKYPKIETKRHTEKSVDKYGEVVTSYMAKTCEKSIRFLR